MAARRLALILLVLLLTAACGSDGASLGDEPRPARKGAGFPVVPASKAEVTVWAIGDGADGGEGSRAVAALVARDDPDLVLYTGDVYQDGTAEEFERNVRGPYAALLDRMLPTPGNHDWPNRATGYDPFWRSVTGAPTPHHYAVRAGAWQIVSLSSEGEPAPGDAQLAWFDRATRDGGTCRLAFWHHPRYSAGSHGDQPVAEPLWEAAKGRVALVLNGHEHNLQRFLEYEGIVQMISGAGGKDHYPVDPDDPRPAFTDDRHDGGIRLILRRGHADYQFVAVDGRVLDRGRVPCRP